MINTFQMNPTMSAAGLKLTGSTQVAGNSGNGLFSILLNNLNGSAETDNKYIGSSLFTDVFPANTVITDVSAYSANNTTGSVNNSEKKSNQASLQSSDSLLSQSAMPDLISFLEKKGFSTEQIDKILLSSRNNEGLIQIHKLVTAIQSARNSGLPGGAGLVIEAAYVPKVQELLFNMGLGVGEVKEVIDNASDQKGVVSLDKLAEALNSQLQGSLTKTELVSLLEQNNISLKSQISRQVNGIPGAGTDIEPNAGVSDTASDAPGLKNRSGSDIQGYDANRAAIEFKREFLNFIKGSSRGQEEAENKNTAAPLNEKAAQAQRLNSLKDMPEIINTGSNHAKTAVEVSSQEGGPITQALSKGQTQWVKGNEGKIIDILNGEKQLNARISDQGINLEQREIMKDPAEFLKQGDLKGRQEILAGIAENRTTAQSQAAEAVDIQENPLSMKEIQTIDLTPQNMNRVTEGVELKGNIKHTYNLPDPLPRVFDRMVIMIKNGEQTGKLIIQPPELGKIDIDLTIKSGHIQANLTTENFAVKEIIEANLNQLKQQLNEQGLIVEQFNVSVGSQNRQFGEAEDELSKRGRGSSSSGAAGLEGVESADDANASDSQGGKYRIDLHV